MPKRTEGLIAWLQKTLPVSGSRPLTASGCEGSAVACLRIHSWNTAKGGLKQKWATPTDSDLELVEGEGDELLGRFQKRTGEAKEAIEKAIKECGGNSCCC